MVKMGPCAGGPSGSLRSNRHAEDMSKSEGQPSGRGKASFRERSIRGLFVSSCMHVALCISFHRCPRYILVVACLARTIRLPRKQTRAGQTAAI